MSENGVLYLWLWRCDACESVQETADQRSPQSCKKCSGAVFGLVKSAAAQNQPNVNKTR